MTSLVGQRIGHFRVVDLIGRGGMGEVYVGHDETLERRVALKTIRADRRLDSNAKARFLREARVLSQLHHPNICQIFDYIAGDEVDVLVLELIAGKNLTRVEAKLSFREKLRVSQQIARVLEAAHEKGIVHRDLKPDNVMLTDQLSVKVLDFGLSRSPVSHRSPLSSDGPFEFPLPSVLSTQSASDESTIIPTDPNAETTPATGKGEDLTIELGGAAPLTHAGAVMGTLAYMSPEQARGEAATPASDVYSMGLLMQQLFTGTPPYEKGLSVHTLVRKVANGETTAVADIDADVTALINRMKSLAPGTRPSAIDVVERIQRILDRPARRIKQGLGASAVAVLILFGAVTSALMVRAFKAEGKADYEKAEAIRAAYLATRAEGRAEAEAETARRERTRAVDAESIAKIEAENARREANRASEAESLARREAEAARRAEVAAIRREETTRKVTQFLRGTFELADPRVSQGKELTGTELLDAARRRVDDLDDEPQTQAAVLSALGSIYANRGNSQIATKLLERSLAIAETGPDVDEQTLFESKLFLAKHYTNIGEYEAAGKLWTDGLLWAEANLGPKHPLTAVAAAGLANLYLSTGKFDDAARMTTKTMAYLGEPTRPQDVRFLAAIVQDAALAAYKQGAYPEAEKLALMAIKYFVEGGETDESEVAECRNVLAWIYVRQGKYSAAEGVIREALPVYERVLGDRHPLVADLLKARVAILFSQGGGEELEALLRRVVDIHREAFPPENPYRLDSIYTLGIYLLFGPQGPLASEAEALLDECLPYFESQSNSNVFNLYYALACTAALQGRPTPAINYLKRALPGSERWGRDIKVDPLLDQLRGNAEFEEIVAMVEEERKAPE
ncbi:MAG: protein kinase [Thermoanaerobaculia bacterium]|jgi:serine/threonine-protein kinase